MNGPADWFKAQQQLWQMWLSFMGFSGDGGSSPFGPDAYAAFRQPFGSGATPANPFAWFQTPFAGFGAASGDPADAVGRWFQQLLETLQGTAAAGMRNADPSAFINSFLQAPLDAWRAFGEAGTDPFGASAWMNMKPSEFAALFDLPALGLSREWATKWRELQHSAKSEFEAAQALGRQSGQIYYRALKNFSDALREPDGEITSLRALYDLWVEVAEAAYRERVMTSDYAEAFGRYINSNARSRKAWQELVNDWQEMLNLPNRREIDSLIEQNGALAARVRELEQAGPSFSIDSLLEQHDALAARVEELEQARPSFETDTLLEQHAALAARVNELEQAGPSFDIDSLLEQHGALAARVHELEQAGPAFDIDSLIEENSALAGRVQTLEQARTGFDIETLNSRIGDIDDRLDALSTLQSEPAPSIEPDATKTRPRKKPKREAKRASASPASRVGPASSSKRGAGKKRPKTTARSSAGSGEFDIGNLGVS